MKQGEFEKLILVFPGLLGDFSLARWLCVEDSCSALDSRTRFLSSSVMNRSQAHSQRRRSYQFVTWNPESQALQGTPALLGIYLRVLSQLSTEIPASLSMRATTEPT